MSQATSIDAALLRRWPLPDPSGGDSKEDRGRVLVVGGSRQLVGGVLLAGVAALRAGAGKLQVATVHEAATTLAGLLPEARVMAQESGEEGGLVRLDRQVLDFARRADAVLVGPGMEGGAATRQVVQRLLRHAEGTTVADAGALHPSTPKARVGNGGLVMTPHHGEMAALLGIDVAQVHAAPDELAAAYARDNEVVLVLKGPTTWIAAPDGRLWVNTGGSPGLGTSGSGDVLAGMIAGLAARGAAPEQAAAWGVHLHAQAGARLSRRFGAVGFLAREIAGEVPMLMQDLSGGNTEPHPCASA